MSNIELFRRHEDPLRHWSWRVRADNGRVVTTAGEGYFSKWNAKRAALKTNPTLTKRDIVVVDRRK